MSYWEIMGEDLAKAHMQEVDWVKVRSYVRGKGTKVRSHVRGGGSKAAKRVRAHFKTKGAPGEFTFKGARRAHERILRDPANWGRRVQVLDNPEFAVNRITGRYTNNIVGTRAPIVTPGLATARRLGMGGVVVGSLPAGPVGWALAPAAAAAINDAIDLGGRALPLKKVQFRDYYY